MLNITNLPPDVKNVRTPGIASDYIFHLPDLLLPKKPIRIVVNCRKSNCDHTSNLTDQLLDCLERLHPFNVKIIGTMSYTETSKLCFPRPHFLSALDMARRERAILVSVDRTRFLRNSDYNGKNNTERPTIWEFKTLQKLANGVILATILHPDDGNERAMQTNRGIGKRGRPLDSKEFRAKHIKRVRQLHSQGKTLREISEEISTPERPISHVTVWNWLNG